MEKDGAEVAISIRFRYNGAKKGDEAMSSTRNEILDAAEALFGQRGFHRVTMRGVAEAVGISVGNLTYYFPKKTDLANALLEREVEAITAPVPPTLAGLDSYLRRMLLSLVDHARMFSDPLIFQSVPQSAQSDRERVARLRQTLRGLLAALREEGLLAAGLEGGSLDTLTDLLMYSHIGWEHTLLLTGAAVPEALEKAMDTQWLALAPWLTEAGRRELPRPLPPGGAGLEAAHTEK